MDSSFNILYVYILGVHEAIFNVSSIFVLFSVLWWDCCICNQPKEKILPQTIYFGEFDFGAIDLLEDFQLDKCVTFV